jgi:hypothetical protein
MSGCRRQCDWDENDVCKSCGIDYSPPKKLRPFHLAFPVINMDATIKFYTQKLGFSTGRISDHSTVFNFHGHQLVAQLVEKMPAISTDTLDGKTIPTLHFGLILEWDNWHMLKAKFSQEEIVVGPYARYEGLPGEQMTFFIKDPSGNHLEFKTFKDDSAIFDYKSQ